MDSIFLQKMREDCRWYQMMSLIYGGIFTFCLYRNMSGITVFLMTVMLVGISVLFLKRAGIILQKGTVRYFAGILLLGISTVLTDNGFFHFFNRVGIILLFMMAMAHQIYRDTEWGFTEYVKKFFIMTGTWITSAGELFHSVGKKSSGNKAEISGEENARKLKRKKTGAVLTGILAAALMLIIVMPLLMMSDEIFSQIFFSIFHFLSPLEILRKIDLGNITGILFTFLFGMISLYAFFAGLFRMNLGGKDKKTQGNSNHVTGITFTGIMAFVYVLYSGIQILFLFFRLDTGLPEGVTYSQYAHQGFWQLLFVSIINFVTVLVCNRIFEEDRVLKLLLTVISVCTCIMILSAGYRMILYVSEYNLSFLRILVLWFLAVLMIIFFGVIYSIYRKEFRLFRYMTAVVSVCYILFSFSRPDALIADYNIRNVQTSKDTDIRYLMYSLSWDAAPRIAQISLEVLDDSQLAEEMESYFREIRKGSEEMSLRKWNYSRSEAAKAAKEWLSNRE